MSYLDDEEEKKLPTYGPDEESIIDRVNAQPLPASASNGAMPSEWPPAVPSEAPGMVPVAPPVAGSQAPTLGAPPPPVAPAAPPNVPQETAQAYKDQQDLAGADVAASQGLSAAKATASTKEADALDEEAQRKADAVEETTRITQEANKRTQQWADRAQAETEKFQKMELHDYWADKSTFNKVLSGMAMLTGAVGRTDNSGNAGMNMINGAIERDFRMQQAKIEKQKTNASAAREQYQMGLSEKDQALSDNKLKEATSYEAAAAKLVALKVRQGIPVEQAQNDKDVIALKQKANSLRLGTLKDVHEQNVEDAKLAIEKQKELDERLRAEAYAKKMGRTSAGGAGSGKAYDAFRAGVLSGAPNVGELAAKAGIKPAQIAEQTVKIRTESDMEAAAHNKAVKGGVDGVDDKRVVRLADGTEAGMAPSARSVPQVQKELRTLPRAIEQLKQLREANDWKMTSRDPRFHNAVLAVASTTSAGSTDANVTHEKGTLTNALGMPNNDAIDRKIAELENQLANTQNQLEPLPDGYVPRGRKPAGGGAAPPPAASKPPPPAKLDNRDLALKVKAQATIRDPKAGPALKASAQAFLDRIGG